jgi:hypothetical protein
MKKTLLVVLSLLQTAVFADNLQVMVASKHFPATDIEVNEFNPGLIYEKEMVGGFSAIAGGYYNSIENLTVVTGIEYQYKQVGVQVGIGTGYHELTGKHFQPMGTVFAEFPITDKVSARASIIPHKYGVAGFGFVVDLD